MESETVKKILIVDDDYAFVTALTKFLAGHGYKVLTAFDAMQAIQNVVKEQIALVILDLGLPAGGGLYVLENLRRTRKIIQLPIIVSTANLAVGIEKQTRDIGASDFIVKPYDLEKLLDMIKTHIG